MNGTNGNQNGISSDGDVNITGGELTVNVGVGSSGYGIYNNNGNVNISGDSEVTIDVQATASQGIASDYISVDVTNGASLVVTTDGGHALYCNTSGLTITGSAIL